MKKYIYNHTSEETAYTVKDYPWGFRLKTDVRYWIESVDTKTGGQRLVAQTKNPTTGAWCKPKKYTYQFVKVLYLDDNGHVFTDGISYSSNEEKIKEFETLHSPFFSKFQARKMEEIKKFKKIMSGVTWTIKQEEPTSIFK